MEIKCSVFDPTAESSYAYNIKMSGSNLSPPATNSLLKQAKWVATSQRQLNSSSLVTSKITVSTFHTMNFALAPDRLLPYSPLPPLQNPKPQQPSNAKFLSPICFKRLSSSTSRISFSNGASRITSRKLGRVGGSARYPQSVSSSSFPEAGDGEEEVVREPSFFEFITSERVKVVAMVALADGSGSL